MAEQAEKMPQEHNLEPTEAPLVVSDVPESEKMENLDKKHSLLVPEAEEPEDNVDPNPCNHVKQADREEEKPLRPAEEFTKTTDLPENERKALVELKSLVQQALNTHEFGAASTPQEPAKAEQPEQEKDAIPGPGTDDNNAKVLSDYDGAKTLEAIEESIVASVNEEACAKPGPQEVFIWGVKLLEDDKTDTVLLKFLMARDFKVKEAFTMLKNTIKWRKEFGIDELVDKELDHELGCELGKAVFMHGYSKEGHPVCYNVYGEFKDKELYHKLFSDEEKRARFLRWRVWFLERSVRKLDFGSGGVSTIVHVNDLRNSPGPNRWELRQATNQALQLLQDNYPEFVAKQVFINVPWWYLALSKMISPFLTQRTKDKFVVAGPSRSAETLLKYIPAEQIPTQYGGLSKDGDFGAGDCATEVTLKPSAKHIVEFPVTQACVVKWEARVAGWEVSYGAEFVPAAEDGYTVIIQKLRRVINAQEQHVISGSYKAGEPGKLVLTFSNLTSKKKMLVYRFKTDQLSLN